MGAPQQMALGAAGGDPAWSSSRKTASVTLTGGGRIATVTVSTVQEVRSDLVRAAGKRYFEVECTAAGSSGASAPGVKPSAAAVDGDVTAAGTITYRSNGQVRNGSTVVATTTTYTTGQTVGVAVDFDAGNIWFSLDGSWILSGDPAAGTSPATTFTPSSSLEALGWFDNVAGTKSLTARFAGSQQVYTPPSGFAAGL